MPRDAPAGGAPAMARSWMATTLGAVVACVLAIQASAFFAASQRYVGKEAFTIDGLKRFYDNGAIGIAARLGKQLIKRKIQLARSASLGWTRRAHGRRLSGHPAGHTAASLAAMCSSPTYDADLRAAVNTHGVTLEEAFHGISAVTDCICTDGPASALRRTNFAFMFEAATGPLDFAAVLAAKEDKRASLTVDLDNKLRDADGEVVTDLIFITVLDADETPQVGAIPTVDWACSSSACAHLGDELTEAIIRTSLGGGIL